MGRSASAAAAGGVRGFPAALTSFTGGGGPVREVAGLTPSAHCGEPPTSECHDNIRSRAMVMAALKSSRTGRRVRPGW